jgi:multiple sugar transport system permease protein
VTAVAPARLAAPVQLRPRRRNRRQGTLVTRSLPLLPAVVLLAVFMLGPIVMAVVNSLTNASLTGINAVAPRFVGLQNYQRLFTSPDFPGSVLLTFVFVLASAVVGQNVVGMLLAVLLRAGGRVVGAVVGTIAIGAWVLPEIVAGFAAYAFFSDTGTLNRFLSLFGIATVHWLFTLPMLCVVVANIWRGTSYTMLVYSAALQEIPPEIAEAAEVDGANVVQQFFRVTLPMIRGTIATNLMLITLQTLSVFTLIWVMTQGGPQNKSMTLPLLAYQDAFKFSQIGYGSAVAVALLVIGAVFAAIYIRMLRRSAA